MTCKFCGSDRDLKRCVWPIEMGSPHQVPARQVIVGEYIQCVENIGTRRNRYRYYWAKVLGKAYPYGILAVMFGIEDDRFTDRRSLYWADTDEVMTVRGPDLCDAPVCEFHVRELDEAGYFHYCMDHWNAWEALR
jgi:hypothetical protein